MPQQADRLFAHLERLVSGSRDLIESLPARPPAKGLQTVDHSREMIESHWSELTPADIEELDKLLSEQAASAPLGRPRRRWRVVLGSFDQVRKERGSGNRGGSTGTP